MVAADDPLVGLRGAGNPPDDVVDGLHVPVKLRLEVDLCRAGPDVIGNSKPSPPGIGSHEPSQRRQQRLRVGVRKRQSRNGSQHLDVREREPLRVLGGAYARRERVSGVKRHIHHAAALHAVPGSPSALGERFTFEVAVLVGVGIDQAADRPVLGRHLGLDAAPARPVPRDGDGAFDGDAQALELLVIGRNAVIDVDQRRRDVAVSGINVVGGQLLVVLARRGVHGHGRLLELGDEPRGFHKLHDAVFGRGEEHVKGLDVRVQSPLLELR